VPAASIAGNLEGGLTRVSPQGAHLPDSQSQNLKSLSDNTFHLTTLGGLALRLPDGGAGDTLDPHRQKLALLTVIALSRRAPTRDQLVGLFWADQPEDRARHSLSNALSHLRRLLGRHAIRPNRDAIALERGVPLTVDAVEFEGAVSRGDWAEAVALYGGPFLDGVYVGGALEFDRWADGERGRLESLYLKACAARHAELMGAGDWSSAEALARRWLQAAPLSGAAATALLDALAGPGTRDADQRALDAYDRLVTRLDEEFRQRPDRAVMDRARAIVERLRASDATGEFRVPEWALAEPEPPAPAMTLAASTVPEATSMAGSEFAATPAAGPRSRKGWALVVGVVVLLAAALLWWRPGGAPTPSVSGDRLPLVAIGTIRAPADSAGAWLGDGIVQMLAARLARTSSVEVVSPELMREILPAGATLSQLLEAGRRASAQWVVSGSVTRSEQGLVMDVNIHAAADGRLISLTTVAAADPIALADRVAVRVLAAAGTTLDGPSLAEVETASPEAYEAYIRYRRAADEDRGADAVAALDAAIALDSGFVSALRERATLAFPTGDVQLLTTLLATFRRHEDRATEFDRTYLASQTAFYAGEHERSEALARQLVERYPRDPRAYQWLQDVYTAHGRWQEAEDVVLRLLALDSLAIHSRAGACVPCVSYARLSDIRLARGNLAGAEQAARRYTEVAPGVPQGWWQLSRMLAARGEYHEALAAARQLLVVAPDLPFWAEQPVRVLIMQRDWRAADSAVRTLRRGSTPGLLLSALDLSATLARERGRHRAAVAALDSMALAGAPGVLDLVAGNSLARIGAYAAAVQRFPNDPPSAPRPAGAEVRAVSLLGDQTRGFAWHRAQEGDALAGSGQTARMQQIADSLEQLSGRSYYGRDWLLHHHIRGLLLAREDRHEEAIAEFRAAHWSYTGWSRTLVEQARSELALGRTEDALETLRKAYIVPLDAMGRYVPRTELDWFMARAFRQAGQADSAARYAGYVEEAWRDADPEIRRLLDAVRP
jgi:DNA-binding SARP family transcriptional activator/tetratricopeptide (TPR) repeat protein